MGDSEDEYDRQRREKFRRERSDVYDRRGERDWSHDRGRGWNGGGPDRGNVRPPHGMPGDGGQRHRPEYGGQPPQDMKRRFSPGRREDDMGPRKRMREFEPGAGPGWRGGPGWDPHRPGFRPGPDWGPRGGGFGAMGKGGERMLTFKQWLSSQPDDIGDEEAITKYTEYKISFKRQQLQEFFVAHKEEEWFKEKYHPDESSKRKQDMENDVQWRAETFKNILERGLFDSAGLDLNNEEQIIRLLDTAVILLEKGTEEDLKVLDKPEENLQDPSGDKKESLDDGEIKDDENPEEDGADSKKQAELFKQLVDDKNNPTDDDKLSGKAVEPAKKEDPGSEAPVDDEGVDKEKEVDKEEKTPAVSKPKLLHQTYSIFMRSLPPTVTRNDIINLCKKFPGFLRVAFSQPIEDHNKFIRRCWVTFQRDVNIRDICWSLNNIRLREIELNPVVNRDLARRVRPISGIAIHKTCARNDLKNVTRLIMHLDAKMKLWRKETDGTEGEQKSENPWLVNISEFLVDESSAEETELLGPEVGMETKDPENDQSKFITIQRDEKLIKQLDILLYYLRLVHSVDYYNASQYPNEDEMPNRCGIIHARGPVPPNKLTSEDVAEFQRRFAEKLDPLLDFKDDLTKEEAAKLGLKNEENEVEKFVSSNTQELGKDKWLCPLSGKKFKGPDYVRKHIFNKHAEKVDAVKKEVAYFNNYLFDPLRPGPTDSQRPAAAPGPGGPPPPGFPPYGARPMGPDPGFPPFSSPQYGHRMPPMAYGGGKTYPPKPREPRGREPYPGRPVIEYKDLDAPDDADFF